MESSSAPYDAATDLAAADAARDRLTSSLRIPSWFHTTLGVGVAAQIGGAAYGLSDGANGPRLIWLVAGLVVFAVVALVLLARFRRLNHVRIPGVFTHALMGSSTRASLAEAAGLAAAAWAAIEGHWWLTALASVAGGAGYAVSARLWWRDYLRDPAAHAREASSWVVALVGGLAVVGAVVLILSRG